MNMGMRMIEAFLTSSVLILVVLVLRRLCRGKISLCLQYGIWLIVAVKLLLVPIPLLESRFSIMNLINVNTETAEQTESTGMVPGTDSNTETTYVLNDADADIYIGEEEIIVETVYPSYESAEESRHTFTAMEESRMVNANGVRKFFHDFLNALPFILCLNAFLLAAWMLFYNIKFYHKLRSARVPYEDEEFVKDSKNPNIYLIEGLKTPCLYGMSIYLPVDSPKDKRRLRHILAHEVSHYRHKDFIWSFLRLICIALNWYNPLVWIAAAIEKQDCELACDETAIKTLGEEERVPYGETLIWLVGEKTLQDAFMISTTMTANKKEIKTRISLIARKPVTVTYMVIFMGAVLIAGIFCTFTGKVEAAEKTEWNTAADVEENKGYQINEESRYAANDETTEVTEGTIGEAGLKEFTEEELTGEFAGLTEDNTFSVYARSISRSAKVIDRFSLPVEVWNHVENPSDYGTLAFSEECLFHLYHFNPELGSMEFLDTDFDEFVDKMAWDDADEIECKVICKNGLITDIVAYNTYHGITYSEPAQSRDYYDLHGTEGYDLVGTYMADVSEAEGMEKILVYSGNMGDGDGGYVLVEAWSEEEQSNKIIWIEEAHIARAGWNNIYLGEINGTAFLFTLTIDARSGFGEFAYHAFRLDSEGNPLPYAGAKFEYEIETYSAETFTQWYSLMSAYMNRSFLLLSTQEGVLKTCEDSSSHITIPGLSDTTIPNSSDTTIPAPEKAGYELIELQRMIEDRSF